MNQALSPLSDPSQNPATVFLSRQAKSAFRGIRGALDNCARLLTVRDSARWKDIDWAAIRYQHVEALKTKLADRYEPNTVNRHLSTLKGVAHEAWRMGRLQLEDFARIKDVKRMKPSGKLAGREVKDKELAQLFGSLPNTANGDRDAALLVVLCAAGLRRTEMTELRLSDWNAEEMKLTIRRGKGGKFREVFLDEDGREALERWLKWRGPWDGPLFCPVHRSGAIQRRHMSAQAVALLVSRAATKNGAKRFTPHDLRRTFASRQLDAGTDIATVADLMGHADVNTTRKYDRRGDDAKRRAARAVRIPFRPPAS